MPFPQIFSQVYLLNSVNTMPESSAVEFLTSCSAALMLVTNLQDLHV